MIRLSVAVCVGLAAIGLTSAPVATLAQPTPTVSLKLTTLDRENDVLSEPLIWWMKTVAERTANRVQVQPFWGQSLVPAPRTMSAVKSGIADIGYFISTLLSSEEKDFSVLELDGALPTDERYLQAWQAIEPVMERILDRNGIIMLWPRPSPKAGIACKSKFLTQASDYAGTKIRVAGRWESASISRWGASTFPIPPVEIYTALQRGTVDCTYLIYPLVWGLKVYEVAPYITRLDDSASFLFMGISKNRWNQITEADRQAIREISGAALRREMDLLGKRQESLIDDMAKAGAKFHTPSPAERKRLTETLKPLWQEVRKAMGPDGVKLADLLEPFNTPR